MLIIDFRYKTIVGDRTPSQCSSWEASALLQFPVYHISGAPHGLQPQDAV